MIDLDAESFELAKDAAVDVGHRRFLVVALEVEGLDIIMEQLPDLVLGEGCVKIIQIGMFFEVV